MLVLLAKTSTVRTGRERSHSFFCEQIYADLDIQCAKKL